VRTKTIEEILLAQMHPVLEHSSFCLVFRIRLLEQNLGVVIAYQPSPAVRGPDSTTNLELINEGSNITTHLQSAARTSSASHDDQGR
jgi:hypothetical protein